MHLQTFLDQLDDVDRDIDLDHHTPLESLTKSTDVCSLMKRRMAFEGRGRVRNMRRGAQRTRKVALNMKMVVMDEYNSVLVLGDMLAAVLANTVAESLETSAKVVYHNE